MFLDQAPGRKAALSVSDPADPASRSPGMVGVLFSQFAAEWIERSVSEGLRCSAGYGSILRTHLLPAFGQRDIGEITRREFRDFLSKLRQYRTARGKPLAPRSIRNVAVLFHTILASAVDDELIVENPARRGRRDLPKQVDGDPSWRPRAIFSRAEVEAILSDPRITELARVAIAIDAFTGPRSGELGALMWNMYEPAIEPLGRITYAWAYSTSDDVIRSVKTGVARSVPVHPALAALLEHWYLAGWRKAFGRDPGPSDLIVPVEVGLTALDTPSGFDLDCVPMRNDGLYQRLMSACRRIGLRPRGPHIMRATFATLTQEGGAEPAMIEHLTHRSSKTSTRVFAGYSRFSWPALCGAVLKLQLTLRTEA